MTERTRQFWWIIFSCYTALVLIISVIPIPPKIEPKIPSVDKITHLIEYFVFSWLLMRAQLSSGMSRGRAAWTASFVALGFGTMCEFIQMWLPYRTAEWMDLVADGIGGVLGTRLVNPRRSDARHG